MALDTPPNQASESDNLAKPIREVENVIIRFAGDSGDGIQVTGAMFTHNSAILGNDISTLPDFPAEIRAPAGTLPGVSSFQLNFSSYDIHTPGDRPDVLVAMNPAGLKVHLADLHEGGLIVLNEDSFTKLNFKKADIETDEQGYAEIEVPMPDNLTTWKVKVWAMGHGTVVGQSETEVITSKDLLVRLQAPRFFVEKDEVKHLGLVQLQRLLASRRLHNLNPRQNFAQDPNEQAPVHRQIVCHQNPQLRREHGELILREGLCT